MTTQDYAAIYIDRPPEIELIGYIKIKELAAKSKGELPEQEIPEQ